MPSIYVECACRKQRQRAGTWFITQVQETSTKQTQLSWYVMDHLKAHSMTCAAFKSCMRSLKTVPDTERPLGLHYACAVDETHIVSMSCGGTRIFPQSSIWQLQDRFSRAHEALGHQYLGNGGLRMQVGMFQVLLLQRSPDRAYKLLQPLEPFLPFRDPSMGTSLFDLTVHHCLCVSPPDIRDQHK